jgi:hypothetical protein
MNNTTGEIMELFSEVRTGIQGLMTRLKFDGYWSKGYWTHINDKNQSKSFPFAIVHNEAGIIAATKKKYPMSRYLDLDSFFDIMEIYSWGYDSEFGICPFCERIFSLNPGDKDFSLNEKEQKICNQCISQEKANFSTNNG